MVRAASSGTAHRAVAAAPISNVVTPPTRASAMPASTGPSGNNPLADEAGRGVDATLQLIGNDRDHVGGDSGVVRWDEERRRERAMHRQRRRSSSTPAGRPPQPSPRSRAIVSRPVRARRMIIGATSAPTSPAAAAAVSTRPMAAGLVPLSINRSVTATNMNVPVKLINPPQIIMQRTPTLTQTNFSPSAISARTDCRRAFRRRQRGAQPRDREGLSRIADCVDDERQATDPRVQRATERRPDQMRRAAACFETRISQRELRLRHDRAHRRRGRRRIESIGCAAD